MQAKRRISNLSLLFILVIIVGVTSSCSASKLGKGNKMSDDEYYSYLRRDTSICKLPELEANSSILAAIDSILVMKEQFRRCNEDLNPFVYSIKETIDNNSLSHELEPLYSTNELEYYYDGAFNYNGQIFVVSRESNTISAFQSGDMSQLVEIPFCNRIYHPKYRYVSRIQGDEIYIECIKNEIITIKQNGLQQNAKPY